MKLWLLHIGEFIFVDSLAGFFLELFSNTYFSPVQDLILFQSRISGNVMTLTGVCKGLSIIAFLAGLRFYNIFRKSSKASPLFYCRFYKLPVGPDSEERLDVDESEKKDKEKEVKEEEEEKKKEKKKKKKGEEKEEKVKEERS